MSDLAWYCIHSKTKCEHVAAAMLRQIEGLETYCPRIRFQRSTPRGKVWFVEALFPSYFFARFQLEEHYRQVKHTHNVLRILEFGNQPAVIADQHIADLQAEMNHQEIKEIHLALRVGDPVELTDGPMRGFKGVIERISQGEDRVQILLEFLGRTSRVEVPMEAILHEQSPRTTLHRR